MILESKVVDEAAMTQGDLEANAFAGLLLMPDALMREQLSVYGISGENIKVDDVLALMELFTLPLEPKRKILFCGPPGCGKTMCAEIVANALDLPILYTCFDGLISLYLGEISSNIRKVFDYASKNNWVLLFDEFDAIGKSRDTIDEHSELKRVVNSFLQILDGFICDSIVIAATNHEKAIDTALWRRFDEIVMFDKPNREQIVYLIQNKLRAFDVERLDTQKFAEELQGCSYADIERVCLEAIKSSIINGNRPITDKVFSENVQLEKKRSNIIQKIGE